MKDDKGRETVSSNLFFYETAVGRIGIKENGSAITEIYFEKEESHEGSPFIDHIDASLAETPLLKKTGQQLMEYFIGQRKSFDLPLAPKGTPFQLKVWKALLDIPYGETRSYKDIAIAVGNPKASRAVGMANNRNPISIIIPCHRVIGSNGKLVGYGGGLSVKEYL
ncbi:MAG: methylated-DNA--[protein]-cysteine S-methyltransferase, partial [Clostridiales bacterium]|nr:methylated-DNA--[protein]-cysteine S-methyltransferase [Clostridiales bacterium]